MDQNFGALTQSLMNYMANFNDKDSAKFVGAILLTMGQSKAQNYQDVWALYESGMKRDGVFVEFGATDGIAGSNTYMLEKDWGWKGILAEPIPSHLPSLITNRPGSRILQKCVFTKSDETVKFAITEENDLSTIEGYGTTDEHAEKRKDATIIEATTISLADLLATRPNKYIDYLSVDTEGSEYDILKAFFKSAKSKKYFIHTISVEHNFEPVKASMIDALLTAQGYYKKFEPISRWDSFWVRHE